MPSNLVDDLDPAVERSILRCLEHEAHERPQSAQAVAAALPGGDLLKAAMVAGETPSPEMVAAAGPVGALSPPVAVALFATLIGFVLLTMLNTGRGNLLNQAQMDKPPVVLKDRARTIVRGFGYEAPPAHIASWFTIDEVLLADVVAKLNRAETRYSVDGATPSLLKFDIRTSPSQMARLSWTGRITWSRPPFDQPGMVRLTLDPQGNLIRFAALIDPDTSSGSTSGDSIEDFDWTPMFDAAGLDESKLTPANPTFAPPVHCESLAEWHGSSPAVPNRSIVIHAGIRRGQLAYFQQEWTPQLNSQPGSGSGAFNLMSVVVVVTGLVFMIRNLRSGRGDRKGAFRLAISVFTLSMSRWVFTADHIGFLKETDLLFRAFSYACGLAVITWAMYLAIEPYARRFLPETLISWTRLLSGRIKDPRVGRDLLVGTVFGGGMFCLLSFMRPVAEPFFFPNLDVDVFQGGRYLLGVLCILVLNAMLFGCGHLVLLLICRILLRRTVYAVAAFMLLVATIHTLQFGPSLPTIAISFMIGIGFSVVVIRYGLLSAIAMIGVWEAMERFAATFDFSQWFASQQLVGPIFVLVLALYGFWISLAGQPIIKDLLRGGVTASAVRRENAV